MKRLVIALALCAASAARADDTVPVWLGIRFGASATTGQLEINRVYDGTAAAQAGLVEHDILLALDGVMVDGRTDLRPLIYPHKVGDHLKLQVLRAGKVLTLDAMLLPRADGEIVQKRLVDKPSPDFAITMPDDGRVLDLASLRGKVAVLAFFPPKCDACASVVSALGTWATAHAHARLVVAGATPIGDVLGLKAFLQRNPIVVPVGAMPVPGPDDDPVWFADPSMDAVTFVVIDAKGIVKLASIVTPGHDDGVEDVCVAAERALKSAKRR